MTAVLVIAAWEKFQHYKDRDPSWIKVYRDLLTAESWVLGTDDSRLVQFASMLLAARYHNATPLNFALFRKVASLDLSEPRFHAAVEHLAASGFLSIQGDTSADCPDASTVLAPRYAREEKIREEERREEKKNPSGSMPRKRGAPRKRCPEDFEIPEPEKSKIRAECPDIDLLTEERKFRDHEFARGRSDWLATWRNWMREAQTRAASRPKPVAVPVKRAPPTDEQISEARRRAAEDNRRELAAKLGSIGVMPR